MLLTQPLCLQRRSRGELAERHSSRDRRERRSRAERADRSSGRDKELTDSLEKDTSNADHKTAEDSEAREHDSEQADTANKEPRSAWFCTCILLSALGLCCAAKLPEMDEVVH